jgi:hypothetical protein
LSEEIGRPLNDQELEKRKAEVQLPILILKEKTLYRLQFQEPAKEVLLKRSGVKTKSVRVLDVESNKEFVLLNAHVQFWSILGDPKNYVGRTFEIAILGKSQTRTKRPVYQYYIKPV